MATVRHQRSRLLVGTAIVMLLLVIAAETAIIIAQREANRHIEAQSERALAGFLHQEAIAKGGPGTDLLMRNVRFCWSRQVCILTDRLSATAIPFQSARPVVFDNLLSFMVRVHRATVLISPKTLEGMFNESVFNYPGSTLRNLTVGIRSMDGRQNILLAGSLKYFLWIPFEMETRLSVDRKTNTLVIAVNRLTVFGFIPATWLIDLKPFNLDKLMTLPSNRYLTVRRNLIMVKPFGLFPPPRIDGRMSAISVTPRLIQLQFDGEEPAYRPIIHNGNSIYLQGGSTQFGRLQMIDTRIQVMDADGADSFNFSLLNYLAYMPQSRVALQKDGAVIVNMPDHQRIPDMGWRLLHPRNDQPPAKGKGASSAKPSENLLQKSKRKLKDWFGL